MWPLWRRVPPQQRQHVQVSAKLLNLYLQKSFDKGEARVALEHKRKSPWLLCRSLVVGIEAPTP